MSNQNEVQFMSISNSSNTWLPSSAVTWAQQAHTESEPLVRLHRVWTFSTSTPTLTLEYIYTCTPLWVRVGLLETVAFKDYIREIFGFKCSFVYINEYEKRTHPLKRGHTHRHISYWSVDLEFQSSCKNVGFLGTEITTLKLMLML